MYGSLYLVATPIGNLEDMTYRAVRVLGEVDLIAAEDTRNSIKLLNHFEIKTPMTSYHEFNKIEKAHELIAKLQSGMNIALITDAGMPGISDPGEEIVAMAHAAGVNVTIVPGACACVSALAISGQKTGRFAFEAFLPSDKRRRAEILEELKNETRTIIIYEAPHHLIKTLQTLAETLGNRQISVVKELTKKYETVLRTDLNGAVSYYEANEPKGEYVLVIEGKSRKEIKEESVARWEQMDIEEHMQLYLDKGMDKKEAMKAVAADRGVGKREIYAMLLNL
ncbi:MAG: 16S rRNA (cytidine(1402)-2'-O)-methyltransferase [Lachnospiraceae bacterium]